MKRLWSLVMAVLLSAGAAGAALAQPEPLRVLAGSETDAQAYLALYPDRAVRRIEVDYEQGYRGNLAELLAEGDWDVAFIGTQEFCLAALADGGLALDLSADPRIAALADTLLPSIRAAVTVGDTLAAFPSGYVASLVAGFRLMGLNESSGSRYEQRAAAHLASLGMTAADQPATFEQLCALGESYLQKPKDARRGTAFITLEGSAESYLLNLLIDLYATQYLATGLCDSFDTEVFRTALGQLAKLRTALAADPKNRYDEDGFCCPLVMDSSQTLITDAVFLRLGESESLPAWMGLAIVNPKSARVGEAVDYILLTDAQNACGTAPAFYRSVDYQALVLQSYDRDIAAQTEQGEDASVIDRLKALRDAGDASRYQYSQAEIERYRADIAPRLVFPQTDWFDSQSAVRAYLLGRTDAEAFIRALDEAAAAR